MGPRVIEGKSGKGGIARKQGSAAPKRIAILDQELCKPKTPAYDYLRKVSKQCPQDCIRLEGDRLKISEEACGACLMRAKRCPDDVVKVVQLPGALTAKTHNFGDNCFSLHGLACPRPSSVLGLLGANGIGKSTILRLLSGRMKVNLGDPVDPPDWQEIVKFFRGSDLQNYFVGLLEDKLTAAFKPQLDGGLLEKMKDMHVGDTLDNRDQRGKKDEVVKALSLTHLMDRSVGQLSGGEAQRFCIAMTLVAKREVYFFDEPSAFLDVKQRFAATQVIRGSLGIDRVGREKDATTTSEMSQTRVVVVDHDLSFLDYISDQVSCLYGEPSAYGVVSKPASAGNAINNYLAGYLPAENVRFRAKPLDFKQSTSHAASDDSLSSLSALGIKKLPGTVQWPAKTMQLRNRAKAGVDGSGENKAGFTLHIEPGHFRSGEIVGLLGENGCGKSTFIAFLAGLLDSGIRKRQASARAKQAGAEAGPTPKEAALEAKKAKQETLQGLRQDIGVSFKRQNFAPFLRREPGTVKELLWRRIPKALGDQFFRLKVLNPMQMDPLLKYSVRTLSGGQLQRLAIVLCLGTPANVYLLDEPSAFLDCEQRANVTKVIRRWVVTHLNRSAFIIEHDLLMAAALYDRIITFDGQPAVECTAHAPTSMEQGFNVFLHQLNITLRRDPTNSRPRINKPRSALDNEQRKAGRFFILNAEHEADMVAAERRKQDLLDLQAQDAKIEERNRKKQSKADLKSASAHQAREKKKIMALVK